MRVRAGLFVAAVVAAALAPPAAAAPAAATGNPAIIAFYRTATLKTNAKPAEQETITKEYWLKDDAASGGSGATFELAWGVPRPSAAYVAVTALVTIRQTHGRPAWELWTFVRACHTCGSVVPVEFFVGPHGDLWGFRTGRVVGCWNRATGTSRWITRDWTLAPPWQVYGHFVAMTESKGRAEVTSTYPISGGGTAREVDTIGIAEGLFVGAGLHNSATQSPRYPPHSYAIAVHYPKPGGVTAPVRHLCAGT